MDVGAMGVVCEVRGLVGRRGGWHRGFEVRVKS